MTARGEVFAAGFLRDVSDRLRREAEREALVREQAARAEAERIAEMVSGMQLLVDAALAHRTLDDIVSDLVNRVRGVLGADAAAIYLAEEGERLFLRAASGGAPDGGSREPVAFGDGFAGRVAQERAPLLAHDPPPGELPYPELSDLEVGSLIGVPLLAEGEVTGVLARGRLGAQDTSLKTTSTCCAWPPIGWRLAIDHARVYEREHRIAETLQRSLLPDRLPQLPGLEVAARYRPAAAEAEVGGDWYDVLSIPGGGVGLVMGDVAGKGLAAASMVGRLRSALRAYALEGHPPARVVGQLNRLLWAEADESQMATLLFVVIDPAEARVRWVNAGHVPPLLMVGRAAAALPRGRQLGAARRAALPGVPGGHRADGAGLHRRPLHRRPDRAAGREHRRRHGQARGARARGAVASPGGVRPPAARARPRGRRHRRRRDPDAADGPDGGPLPSRVPRRARVAVGHALAFAPLASARARIRR